MNPRLRVALIALVVIIALYFVISQPDNAAAAVRSVIAAIGTAIGQIFRFIQGLTA